MVGASSNSYGRGPTQAEEELNLVSVGMLPSHYKGLVSTSIYLAPPQFHESMERCPLRKLLKRILADNIRVSNHYSYSSRLFFASSCLLHLNMSSLTKCLSHVDVSPKI